MEPAYPANIEEAALMRDHQGRHRREARPLERAHLYYSNSSLREVAAVEFEDGHKKRERVVKLRNPWKEVNLTTKGNMYDI